jgi:hypothetical protein
MVWRRSFPRMQAIRVLREGILGCGMLGVKFVQAAPQLAPEVA